MIVRGRQLSIDAMDNVSVPSVDELAALVEARASDDSSRARLQAAIQLGRKLTENGDAPIERFVAEGRADGLSWTQIGMLFGSSKQAAQKRYGAGTPGAWPGRWTVLASGVLDDAVRQAQGLRHDYVGTEHVLIALLAPHDSVAGQVLRAMGVERDRILGELSGSCTLPRTNGQEVMPRLKQSLENAQRIANALGDSIADTEHLLAGVLAVPDAFAVHILIRHGVDPDNARAALARRLGVDPLQLVVPRARRRRHFVSR